ncbi:MAG: hypothetical protein KF886_11400 [Candidatus Hydrogenedentes bacterium]|nr:hypothetical protein [Candidatus Hydrogenedentota bacterium]
MPALQHAPFLTWKVVHVALGSSWKFKRDCPAESPNGLPRRIRSITARRLLLFLLHAAGGRLSKLDLQKLLFLYVRESGTPHYTFVPCKYGCYSFQATNDLDLMVKRGWIAAGRNQVDLRTPLAGQAWAAESPERARVTRWLARPIYRWRGSTRNRR